MKKCYRFFGGFLDTQENWLNQMAQKGYRLIKTGKMTYDFEECQPAEYQYAIEFVAQQSFKKEREYRAFLEELGYKVFYKNANLNFSAIKLRWRPYGSGMGQISTKPGNYNKELFIVEKRNTGKPFELHTTNSDKFNYYKSLRNAWLVTVVMLLTFVAWQFIDKGFISKGVIAFGILGILCSIPTIRYQKRISAYSVRANIEE